MENQILRCDDDMCDDVNCRIYWSIINKSPNRLKKYNNFLENKYNDKEDIDYKLIVEALILKI